MSYLIVYKNKIEAKNYYFKVNYVEKKAQEVHGLSVEKLINLSRNRTFFDQIDDIWKDFQNADLLVAHNFEFDIKFLKSEFLSCGRMFAYKQSFCTMRYFTHICKLPRRNSRYGGYKFPKLKELVDFFRIDQASILNKVRLLFDDDSIGFHDSRFDVIATWLCYLEGIKRGYLRESYVLCLPFFVEENVVKRKSGSIENIEQKTDGRKVELEEKPKQILHKEHSVNTDFNSLDKGHDRSLKKLLLALVGIIIIMMPVIIFIALLVYAVISK